MTKPRYSIIPGGASTDPHVIGWDLKVLCFLGEHTNKLGWCFLSQGKIADAIGIGRATVQRSLARLVEAGYVEVKSSVENGRPHACHAYRVIMDRDDPQIGPSELEVEDQMAEGGCPPAGTPMEPGGAHAERARVPAIDGHGVPTHTRAHNDQDSELDDDGDARASVLSAQCFEVAREVGSICGYATAADWPPGWSQAHYRVQKWLNAGWDRTAIIAACRDAMVRKRDGPPSSVNYFDKPIATWIARRDQPLPEVKIQERETVNVVRKTDNPARDEFRSALGELKDFNRGARARSAGSGEVVQLLPPDRDR